MPDERPDIFAEISTEQLLVELKRRGWSPPATPIMEIGTQEVFNELEKRFDAGYIFCGGKTIDTKGTQNFVTVVFPTLSVPDGMENTPRLAVASSMYLHAILANRIYGQVPRQFNLGLSDKF
jgi:hypothetical protein